VARTQCAQDGTAAAPQCGASVERQIPGIEERAMLANDCNLKKQHLRDAQANGASTRTDADYGPTPSNLRPASRWGAASAGANSAAHAAQLHRSATENVNDGDSSGETQRTSSLKWAEVDGRTNTSTVHATCTGPRHCVTTHRTPCTHTTMAHHNSRLETDELDGAAGHKLHAELCDTTGRARR
jgi:hypothetical protein